MIYYDARVTIIEDRCRVCHEKLPCLKHPPLVQCVITLGRISQEKNPEQFILDCLRNAGAPVKGGLKLELKEGFLLRYENPLGNEITYRWAPNFHQLAIDPTDTSIRNIRIETC